ncbi:RHS repeat domain-containing protein [Luteimonas saliphila]|uniref:RHS repeat domain-containing protein n=1 Tax=Luteimonas saliphila TaxID=2804919 RepID=UPI00192E1953|nr:RHS repeat-associated core domain-containing protein [Luteimonas saliphila]
MDYLVRCRYALVACLSVMSVIPVANAQTYSRTEVIEYHDDLATYVLGQVKKTTCAVSAPAHDACDGQADSVISQVDYGWKAMPSKTYSFGKPQETFSYETAVAGQLGTLKTIADGNNNVTTLSSWKRGIPQSIKYPATPEAPSGATQTAVVDDNGWIRSINDEMNSKTCYDHDLMGRVKKITYPSETQANVCNTSKWAETTIDFSGGHAGTYGLPTGHWRRTMLTGNGRKIVFYDALWRPVVEQTLDLGDPNNTVSAAFIRYDAAGRPSFRSYSTRVHGTTSYLDQTLKGTHTVYDALDRVTQVRQDWEGTGQLTTTTEYLAGFQTRVTNPRNHQTLTTLYQTFDEPSYDLPRGINHPEGAFTEIHRDIFGKVTALKRRNANGSVALTRSYAYNVNQELCRSVEPETGATVMGYDGAGNLTWSAAGLPASTACHTTGNTTTINARKAARTYDGRNRLTALTFPGDGLGNQTWTYHADGLPSVVTTRNDITGAQQAVNSYTYNRRRLLTRENLQFGTVFTWPVDYAYNGNGHLSSLTWHGLPVNYAPNALGQPTQAGTFATGVSYHPNGGIKQFTYGNGITHTLTQNARGLPDTSCDFYGSCGASAFLYDGYDYDQNGNVKAISDGRTGNHGNRTMTYDGLDRLTKVVSGNGSSNPMFGTATYTYDVLDNLTGTNVTGGNQPRNHYYCYDATWRLTNVKTGSCSGTTVMGLGYDVQGNLANQSGRTYAFDFGNRLRSNSGSPASNYAYDGHGRRVLDQVGTGKKYTHYLQDGRLSMTADERLGKVAEYVYLQGSLVGIRERDVATNVYTTKYQHTDALGSPVAITNQSRSVLERTDYEPYGSPTNRAWRDGPGYTGHVEDAATQLSYMQQRYYDPMLGRMLSVDPVTAYSSDDMRHFNLYAYAYNNPQKFTDPDGRCPQCLWGAPIGAGVNLGVQLVTGKGSFSERWSNVSWGQVAVAGIAGGLSGGVSAIASTATTTSGTVVANVIGNAGVGALATQASAQVDGRTASVGEVAQGAVISGAAAGLGTAIEAAPGAVARSTSTGMSQTERTAVANLLDGIRHTTPGFTHSNPTQTAANAIGAAVSASPDIKPIIEQHVP